MDHRLETVEQSTQSGSALRAIVGATRNRLVRLPWGEFSVPPPTVRQVLTIVLCGQERDESVLYETLDGWLPAELVAGLRDYQGGVTYEYALKVAGNCIQDGAVEMPSPKEKQTRPEDLENPSDWADLVADYAHAYGLGFQDVLEELWHGFTLLARKIPQVYARDQYRAIEANGIPHIADEQERHQAYHALRERAKLPRLTEEAERRLKLEKQRKTLAEMESGGLIPSTKGYKKNGVN